MATARVLVIGGGGSGTGAPQGNVYTGGGGGGGYQYDASFVITPQIYEIVVGEGGTYTSTGTKGGDSIFDSITAEGGGSSVTYTSGEDGGCGGGGIYYNGSFGNGGAGSQGGNGGNTISPYTSGSGGGGAGNNGGNASASNTAGNGGDGIENDITGIPVTYAGGGGGGSPINPGTGGDGGGANGVSGSSGQDGTDGLGGGGGGVSSSGGAGAGDGGNGVVIVSYTTSEFEHTGGDDTGTDGSLTWVKFTSSGDFELTEAPIPPTVTTQAVTAIEADQATGNGNITDIGDGNATRRGFAYIKGKGVSPTITDSIVYDDGDFGTGAFDNTLT